MRYLIGRCHEVALKGANRWRFVEQLKRNVKAILGDLVAGEIRSQGPRLIVPIAAGGAEEMVATRARLVFGFQNFSLARAVPPDLDAMNRAAVELVKGLRPTTFRVRARRADKRFPLTSLEIERRVGAVLKEFLGARVDRGAAELTVVVEVLPGLAYVSLDKLPGPGGLPVGVSGRAAILLSGGFDSPVAAYRMMRRGLRLCFIHFHSHPLVSAASRDKAVELARHLARYQAGGRLFLVPFAEAQRAIVARVERPLRVVMYRRMMLRIAERIARRNGASALVTGESLGQVASQTLPNMAVIEAVARLPVLRPLVGMDKNEIIAEARRLGTFEISAQPDEDCCTLFVPRHPETAARKALVEAAEATLEVEALARSAARGAELVMLPYPEPTFVSGMTRASDASAE